MSTKNIMDVQDWESSSPMTEKEKRVETMTRIERDLAPKGSPRRIRFAPPTKEEMEGKDMYGNPIKDRVEKMKEDLYRFAKDFIRERKPKYTMLEEVLLKFDNLDAMPEDIMGLVSIRYNDDNDLVRIEFSSLDDLEQQLKTLKQV